MNEIGKRVALATVEVVTSTTLYYSSISVINRVRPSLLRVREGLPTEKEAMIDLLKVIGVTVGIAVGAAVVAGYVRDSVEGQFWPEIEDYTIE